jgi:hypothetical protein
VLAGGLAAVACGREPPSFDAPPRPRAGQLTICGETGLDGRFDALIRKGKEPRQEVRRPLVGLYDLLKKPDLFRDRSALFVPLAAGLSREPCTGRDREACPGRAEWADGLRQAGVDAVSLAAPVFDGRAGISREGTAGILAESGICAAWGDDARGPCVLAIGARKVAVVALGSGAGAAERAKRLVVRAREAADVVLVALAFGATERPEARLALARAVADAAKPEILVAHHPGPFGGVELREGRILLHNPGALLGFEEPDADGELAFCHRLHFGPEGVAWLEAIPVFVDEGRSRQAYLQEAGRAVGALVTRSRELGTELRDEFGRGILDLAR